MIPSTSAYDSIAGAPSAPQIAFLTLADMPPERITTFQASLAPLRRPMRDALLLACARSAASHVAQAQAFSALVRDALQADAP